MFKYVLFFVILAVPLQVASQEQQESEAEESERVATSVRPTSIRFSPPSPWLLGFPGWEIAQTKKVGGLSVATHAGDLRVFFKANVGGGRTGRRFQKGLGLLGEIT
jgi:hypothetical protein